MNIYFFFECIKIYAQQIKCNLESNVSKLFFKNKIWSKIKWKNHQNCIFKWLCPLTKICWLDPWRAIKAILLRFSKSVLFGRWMSSPTASRCVICFFKRCFWPVVHLSSRLLWFPLDDFVLSNEKVIEGLMIRRFASTDRYCRNL